MIEPRVARVTRLAIREEVVFDKISEQPPVVPVQAVQFPEVIELLDRIRFIIIPRFQWTLAT
jgi:hypothetical protein